MWIMQHLNKKGLAANQLDCAEDIYNLPWLPGTPSHLQGEEGVCKDTSWQ